MEQPREPKFYPNEAILPSVKVGQVVEEKEKNVYAEERELLHKQLELLAEKSKDSCSPETLSILSEQMVKVYSALNPF